MPAAAISLVMGWCLLWGFGPLPSARLARRGATTGDEVRRPWVEVQCRADGRPLGYDEPRQWSAALVIPLHPDEPDVPTMGEWRYWWRGLTGREFHRTSVRGQLDDAIADGELVRHTIARVAAPG